MSSNQQFKVHPSVIYSLIREQAGTPEKAIAELVMNSVDAGATEIHLTISSSEFTISDNGKGFESLTDIENFFGTFGTPHFNDAKFGQFRLGRGQIFGISATEWRSGLFGMSVDLGGVKKDEDHGYTLHEYDVAVEGCTISGKFYTPLHELMLVAHEDIFNSSLKADCEIALRNSPVHVFNKQNFFSKLVRYIAFLDIAVYVNGVMVSCAVKHPALNKIGENEVAEYYLIEKSNKDLILINQGVYISSNINHLNSYGYIINFKKQPSMNIARNSVVSNCPILQKGYEGLYISIRSAISEQPKFKERISISALSLRTNCEALQYFNSRECFDLMIENISCLTISAQGVKETTFKDVLMDGETNYVGLMSKYDGLITKNIAANCHKTLAESPEDHNYTIITGLGHKFVSRYFDAIKYHYDELVATNNHFYKRSVLPILNQSVIYDMIDSKEYAKKVHIIPEKVEAKSEIKMLYDFAMSRIKSNPSYNVFTLSMAKKYNELGSDLESVVASAIATFCEIVQNSSVDMELPVEIASLLENPVQILLFRNNPASKPFVLTYKNKPLWVIGFNDVRQGRLLDLILKTLLLGHYGDGIDDLNYNLTLHNFKYSGVLNEFVEQIKLSISSVMYKATRPYSRNSDLRYYNDVQKLAEEFLVGTKYWDDYTSNLSVQFNKAVKIAL